MLTKINTVIDKYSIQNDKVGIITVISISIVMFLIYFIYIDYLVIVGLYALLLVFPLFFFYVAWRSLFNGIKSFMFLRALEQAQMST